jgi:hypothetical protein
MKCVKMIHCDLCIILTLATKLKPQTLIQDDPIPSIERAIKRAKNDSLATKTRERREV